MKTFKKFYEEVGAAIVSGEASNTSPIVTGSMIQTDFPVIRPNTKKKPPIVRRKAPL